MTDALWKLPAMIALFVLLWAAISVIPWFAGPRGGYGIHSDGQDWGGFSAPYIAFAVMALLSWRVLGWV